MPAEKLVNAVALKDFTSTVHGNLSQGDPVNQISQARFNVWKEQGLVDYPKKAAQKTATEMPEPKPKAAPKKKAAPKPKGKARK